jgi:prolyl-tRNA editing enzyme YbaK/EbsC (Cys-tRNA(Pro) deacylase)
VFSLGTLTSVPASRRPDLLAEPTRAALQRAGWMDLVGVVEIDPAVSDTSASRETFEERLAACVVLFTTRADVNGSVRRRLDVRKASFLSMERAVELSGMEYGGINPIGLPAEWPVLVDRRVVDAGVVLIGSGLRRSKILLPGVMLGDLPSAEVSDGLGRPA